MKVKWKIVMLASALLLAACQQKDQQPATVVATQQPVHQENNAHNHNHNHNHSHSEETEIYEGYFDDSQVADRPLSDWQGEWQSVYPHFESGALDEVFEHKAQESLEKTFEQYKAYYGIGYQTDVDNITMGDNTISFHVEGKTETAEYTYEKFEILTYEAGNRGVRFLFSKTGGSDDMPKFIQFSDHGISPQKFDHYHLYWGEDQEELLEEMDRWPTYYPASLDGHDIAHEMMAH